MEPSTHGSVSMMIASLKEGENDAATDLWNRYFERLVRVADRKFGTAPKRVSDEEDIALSVMNNLINGAARGQFPQLKDREELWKLLLVMTSHKVTDQVRGQLAQKRGAGGVRGESVFVKQGNAEMNAGWDIILDEEPTPAMLAAMDEQYEQLMNELEDDTLKRIAQLKLESYTNEEIAEQLNVTSRTVKRKAKLIREKWLAYGDREFSVG